MPSLDKAIELFNQSKLKEGLEILFQLQNQPVPVENSFLIWAIILKDSPFKFLALEAARQEIHNNKSDSAAELVLALTKESADVRSQCPAGLPKISFIGLIDSSNAPSWRRCIEALSFQRYVNAELCLLADKSFTETHNIPSFVTVLAASPTRLESYEVGIKRCTGEIVSILEDPTTIFSDNGLQLVGNFFQASTEHHILQTERVYSDRGGYPEAMRTNFPEWDQATLLDPVNLIPPTMVFSWQDVFFRRSTLVSALPLDKRFPNSSALEVASRLIPTIPFHSGKYSVLVNQAKLYAKSPVISLRQRSEALLIIGREKLKHKVFATSQKEPPKKANSHLSKSMDFPVISPEILIRGRQSQLKISLVTASFNCKDFIGPCIDSILSQNYPNLEYIILDGGSTDGTKEIIQRYEKHLTFFRSAPDSGHYSAIQEGIDLSTGPVMSWLNADDLLCPYTLALVAHLFSERKELSWITGVPALTTEDNILDISRECAERSPAHYLNDGFDDPFIQQEGTFWTRELWNKAGGCLDLSYHLAGDMELWTRFFQITPVYTSSVPLGVFRKRSGQRSDVFKDDYQREAVLATERLRINGATPALKNPEIQYVIDVK